MGRTSERIGTSAVTFIERQHMFFVASAPTTGGHVNVSPKGLDTFRILDDRRVAYLDLTGSGIETIGHIRENGRLTILFCAFDGKPRILRLSGTGRAITLGDGEYAELAALFPGRPGARAVIVLEVDRVADSCGYSVPLLEYVGERDVLDRWAGSRSDEELTEYRLEANAQSIDGIPAWSTHDEAHAPSK